jgi:beta-lactamase class A
MRVEDGRAAPSRVETPPFAAIAATEGDVGMEPDWSEVVEVVGRAEAFGTVGVALEGPGGRRWSHHGHRRFRAASVVKIPLMIDVYRRVEAGTLRLDEPHVLTDADRATGSGVLLHLHAGLNPSIEDLVYLTMSISDNTATNLLIRRVGMTAVNQTIRSLGMTGSALAREMKGRPAEPGEEENWATPEDYLRVLRLLLDGQASGPAGTAAMVTMLERQQNGRRIGRYVPEAPGVRWGSKTGGLKGVTNDVGFVTGPGGRLILSVFCEAMADLHVGEQCIGDIARAAMRATGVVTPLDPAAPRVASDGR